MNRWVFIAQPGPDARLVQMQRDDMAHAAALVERWTLRLSEAASRGTEPKETVRVAPAVTVQCPQEPCFISGKDPVVWVTHRHGSGSFLGNPTLAVNGDCAFPLASPAWLEELPRNLIDTASTEQVFASGEAWTGLDAFQRTVWQALTLAREAAEAKERERLARRHDNDAARVDQSIRQLAEPLTRRRHKALPDAGHPLVRACEAIGRAQRIAFIAPPEVLRGLPMRDPVRSICRSSGVRFRRVVLEESWYRREGLPLLAFREAGQEPVALLPKGSRDYEIFDPAAGTVDRVTGEQAATLQPFAYTFYRPFHARPVTLKYLCLFGLSGAWTETLVVLGLGLVGGLLGLAMPILAANVFDTIIPGAQRQRMLETALFLVAATVASTMLNLTRDFTTLRIENKLEAKVQAAIFDRLLSLPTRFCRQFTAGELAQRAGAIGTIRKMLTGSATSVVFSGIFSLFNFVLLFRYSLQLALVALVLTAIQLSAFVAAALLSLRVQRQSVPEQTAFAGLMLQLIGGVPKMRVSGTESRAFAVWSKAAGRITAFGMRAGRISTAFGVFSSAFPLLGSLAIYYVAGHLTGNPAAGNPDGSGISTGSFIAFGSAYGTFSGALMQLAQVGIGLLAIVPIYKSAKPILDAEPESDPSKPQAGDLAGKIELSHVQFRYRHDGPGVLKDLTLTIGAGQFVAFVGPSGSGKSTVFRILLGFEKPESGTVFYDGQDINTLDTSSIRQQMGVVLQNSTVFNGNIFQNIVCSAPYTLDQAWEAARMAGFEKDLRNMPMGMHTVVGDGGAGLSGGQRQRLMIARAIVGKPRILLFDEATSALDNQTQAIVNQSLENMHATRVVIAHRLTTVMKADRIFVIEKGELVQSGTYAELLNQPGPFAELAKRQLT